MTEPRNEKGEFTSQDVSDEPRNAEGQFTKRVEHHATVTVSADTHHVPHRGEAIGRELSKREAERPRDAEGRFVKQ